MTLNKLQSEILKVCKYCDKFIDTGRKRNRYQCASWKRSIFDAHDCRKTKWRARKKFEEKDDDEHEHEMT